ncbi:MAG TPA: D-alanyl-D-alanine carboxypeptidase/D-alanyl-D-alanine-endopeptidase [Verrucomicrobiae bacterium]|nr:D-alanyl-D-alanine carboxypeptidase/D-alanyl-D-alanine-endopeptidase [Verrucomicrobiae bacterium]
MNQRLIVLLFAFSALVGAAKGVAPTMTQILATPLLRHAIVAGEVYDLDTHRVLFARNALTYMEAASTTKLLTEGTSLALLGPGFRWTTPVYRTGSLDGDGTLHGDLVLVASGDPNISQRIQPNGTLGFENEDHAYDGSPHTKAVPGDPLIVLRQLAAQVKSAGVKAIDGRVAVDASLFASPGPEGGTGTMVSPMILNDNVVDVTIAPGAHAGDAASIAVSPQTPYVRFVNNAKTGKAGSEPTIDMSNDVTQPNGSHVVTITGATPAGPTILYAYRVPNPDVFAAMAFASVLQDAGISVTTPSDAKPFDPAAAKASYTAANLVATHTSLPLAQDVRITLKLSDNLHAAMGPYTWAVHLAPTPHADPLAQGFALEHAMLVKAGLDVNSASMTDGLGVSAFFTPDFMVHYLAWVRTQPWYNDLHNGLPIMGVDGTLFNIQNDSPAAGKVFAKTGTFGAPNELNDNEIITAKGLAGFMTTRSGHHVAFAFYINRTQGNGSIYDEKDIAHTNGELLGAMATAAWLTL